MDKLLKLGAVAVILGIVVQGALYAGAWMDDQAFEKAVQQCIGDNMNEEQMQGSIFKQAEQAKIDIPEDGVDVTLECTEGGGGAPVNVTRKLGGGLRVTKSCRVTATVSYVRRVGLMKKPVEIVQTKRFAAGAETIVAPHREVPDTE